MNKPRIRRRPSYKVLLCICMMLILSATALYAADLSTEDRQLIRDTNSFQTGHQTLQSPDYLERIAQGGIIGYVILALGGLALCIVLERFCYLSIVGGKIIRQTRQKVPKANNALGRIMRVYTGNPDQETETLSYKLDEAILKEMPLLERGLAMIAVFAAITPLLGLLGTVIGMIETFQAITLFGAGDPKLMAGGISQALVTTELGLGVAIPIILLHSLLVGKSNRLIQILDEQSAGMVAALSEKNEKNREISE